MWKLSRVWPLTLALALSCSGKTDAGKEADKKDKASATSKDDTAPQDKTGAEPKKPATPPVKEKPAATLAKDETAHEGKHIWSQRHGGEQSDNGRAVAVDAEGNTFLTGFFTDEATVGDQKLVATTAGKEGKKGQLDAYLLKLDKDGKPVFTVQIGGKGQQIGASVTTDSAGNAIVVGWFGEELKLGDGVLKSTGSDDIFVAKYAPDGRRLWAKQYGGLLSDSAYDVTVDGKDNVYITGDFQDKVAFGDDTLTSVGMSDIYILKLDSAGNEVWTKRLGDEKEDFGRSIAAGPGGIVVLGEFSRTPDFGGGALESLGNRDIVAAKYTEDGSYKWAKRFGTEFDDLALAVTVDASGAVGIAGSFEETLRLGEEKLRADGKGDVLILRLDINGEVLWARGFGGPHDDVGFAIANDSFGNLYVGGWFRSKTQLGKLELKSSGKRDAFLVKLSPAGDYLWAKAYGGKEHDQGSSVAVTKDGFVIFGGTFRHTVNFGGADLSFAQAKGAYVPLGDAFVTRLTR